MSDAAAQIKQRLGRDAVILSTRVLQRRMWLGLRKTSLIEVTARRAAPTPTAAPAKPATKTPAPQNKPQVATGAPPAANRSHADVLETPLGVAAVVKTLTGEMESLRRSVMGLQQDVISAAVPLPPEMIGYHRALLGQQVDIAIAIQLLQQVRAGLRPEQWSSPLAVLPRLVAAAEKLLAVAGPIRRVKTKGPHVVSLIGPTGVGKTTTIAKLAARVKLHDHQSVGLITMDTYRIAAVDQLRRYAEILSAPLKVVSTPADLVQAVAALSHMDYVLIDSAGRSPSDAMQISELARFQEAARPDETHLVLSSTSSQSCLGFAIDRFNSIPFNRLILTKTDESPTLGQLFGLLAKLGRPISYLTTGQDVPDHIELAASGVLARRIVEAAFASLSGQPSVPAARAAAMMGGAA